MIKEGDVVCVTDDDDDNDELRTSVSHVSDPCESNTVLRNSSSGLNKYTVYIALPAYQQRSVMGGRM
jgi:hypothetical protein